ncbi:MAG: P-loop NTPase fold protein [Pseudomonadota bacterium]|nr:P-loop NTPase fold protein [Pseudomonadota bacterium]
MNIFNLTSIWPLIAILITAINHLFICWEKKASLTWTPPNHIDNDGIDTPEALSEKLNFKAKGLSIANQIITNSQIKSEGSSPYQSYAILGDWGSGKSFLLNEVLNELHNKHGKDTHVIHINPWQFQTNNKSVHLTEACLQQIRDDLGKNFFIPFIHISFHKFIHKVLPTIAETGLTSVIQQLFNFIPNNKEPRDAIQEAINATGRHIILIIDDIDRLSSSEAHDIFRFTRATLNFKNMSVIMCLDKEKTNVEQSDTYFQKVIHHEFVVPQVQYRELRGYIISHIFNPKSLYKGRAKPHKYAEQFKDDVTNLFQQSFMQTLVSNIRHAKKLVLLYNSYKDTVLNQDIRDVHYSNIHLADWLCLQSIRMHSSQAYKMLENSLVTDIDTLKKRDTIAKQSPTQLAIGQEPEGIYPELSFEVQSAVEWLLPKDSSDNKLSSTEDQVNIQSYRFRNPNYRPNYFAYSNVRGFQISPLLISIINKKNLPKSEQKKLTDIFVNISHGMDSEFIRTLSYIGSKQGLKVGKDHIISLCKAIMRNDFNHNHSEETLQFICKHWNHNWSAERFFLENLKVLEPQEVLRSVYYATQVAKDKSTEDSYHKLLNKIIDMDLPYFNEDITEPSLYNNGYSLNIIQALDEVCRNRDDLSEQRAFKIVNALKQSQLQREVFFNSRTESNSLLRQILDINSCKPVKEFIDFLTSSSLVGQEKAYKYIEKFKNTGGKAKDVFEENYGIYLFNYMMFKYNQTYVESREAKYIEESYNILSLIKLWIDDHELINSNQIQEYSNNLIFALPVLKDIMNNVKKMSSERDFGKIDTQKIHKYLVERTELLEEVEVYLKSLKVEPHQP